MSISGCADRHSTTTHADASTTAASEQPDDRAEPQPQVGASLTATSRATSQPDSRTAASQLIRPGVRDRRLGDEKWVATAATATTTPGIQNSQW